ASGRSPSRPCSPRAVAPAAPRVVGLTVPCTERALVDYAFAPGPTPFDVEMGHLLDNRPTTDLLPRSLLSVHAFIDQLDTLSSVTKPVESMFIASHAHP